MVQNYQHSDCTIRLMNALNVLFPDKFHNFLEIKAFKLSFQEIYQKELQNIKSQLSKNIEELNNTIKTKSISYNESLQFNYSKIDNNIQDLMQNMIPKERLIINDKNNSFTLKIKARINLIKFIIRLKWIRKFRDNIAKKPIKSLQKEIKSLQSELDNTIHNSPQIISKWMYSYDEAKELFEQSKEIYAGAIGEEKVIEALQRLPDTYILLNNIRLELNRSVIWKKYGEWVRTAQVDHILVGPTGIFLLETKNWSRETFIEAGDSPHKQISRVSFILWILAQNRFNNKLPVRNVVVTMKKQPLIDYEYVNQIAVSELCGFVQSQRSCLNNDDIQTIVNWLIN